MDKKTFSFNTKLYMYVANFHNVLPLNYTCWCRPFRHRDDAPLLGLLNYTYIYVFVPIICINMTGLIIVQNPLEKNQVGVKNWRNAIDFPLMAWIKFELGSACYESWIRDSKLYWRNTIDSICDVSCFKHGNTEQRIETPWILLQTFVWCLEVN